MSVRQSVHLVCAPQKTQNIHPKLNIFFFHTWFSLISLLKKAITDSPSARHRVGVARHNSTNDYFTISFTYLVKIAKNKKKKNNFNINSKN